MLTPELKVDLDAIASNYDLMREKTLGEASAVLKSNAYGFGLLPVARRLMDSGCQSIFVGSLDEARELRTEFKEDLYLLLTHASESALRKIREISAIPVLHTLDQLKGWRRIGNDPCALFFNTGMNRLGITADEIDAMQLTGLNVKLVMTHLACADEPEHPQNELQLKRFKSIAAMFPGIRTSIGNSAATLSNEELQGDLTRPGIGLYGGNPFTKLPNPMKVAGECRVPLLASYRIATGETVGYGATYTAERDMQVGVLSMGYADGIPRHFSTNQLFVFENEFFPLIGRVSMELVTIDLSSRPSLKPGEYLEFFGSTQHVDDVAQKANTISYEIFTGLGARVKRIYYPSRQN